MADLAHPRPAADVMHENSALAELMEKRREQIFPKLSSAQIARLAAHGREIATHAGEILVSSSDHHRKLLVVLTGSMEIILPTVYGTEVLNVLLPGDFAGELSTLRGVAGFVSIRVREAGTALEIDEESLRNIVLTDAELSEILMRAFILRRVGLLATGHGEVMLLGSRHCARTLKLRAFLTRNNFPYVSIDVDTDPGVQALLDRFHVGVEDIPVLIGRGGQVFKNPSIRDIARVLEMNPATDDSVVHDMLVVGAGPAGLAAAVYAASEGLEVLVVEAMAPGGQAGSSSKIENYLGFPTGISGQALAGRAFVQAQKFGARLNVACTAKRLQCDQRPYTVELSDGRIALASTIIIATGAKYRELALENLAKFTGMGVYYAATHLEAKLCGGEEVIIVGGGNSAGQAAVFLAGSSRHVHVMVRARGLADSMSRYLIRRIEETPNITLHTRTEITALEGDSKLERVTWHHHDKNETVTRDIGNVFLMTGAVPNTRWLEGCVRLDDKGFVCTGPDLQPADLDPRRWPLTRAPYLLETNIRGVFAVGDVRSGSAKRVASAVGEGSVCVRLAHSVLHE